MMHRNVRFSSCLGALLSLTLLVGTARAEGRIAYVDMQRAIGETSEGKAAMAKLKAEVDKKQKELEQKKEELKKLNDDLNKQATVLKPELLEKKRQELEGKMMQWQEAAMRSQRELQEKEQKATQPIVDRLMKAIGAIAARDKFSAVLRQEMVLWPQHSENDITNEVIRRANEPSK